MTVKQLTENIGSEELSEWMAYNRVEPLDNPDGEKHMPQRKKPQTALEQRALLGRIIASKE